MIRVLIADDEPLARRGIKQLLAPHRDCVVVATCRNGPETVRALREVQPDVVFIDIEMPGLNGFEALRVAEAEPVVVFVTAYDEFAIRAFEQRAIDYLLKPVSRGRFAETLTRVRERVAAKQVQHLVASGINGDVVLRETEVDWIEAANYCSVIHSQGQRYIMRTALADLERQLQERMFIRVHRSAIVRLDRIRAITRDPETYVVLRDGTKIPVSRRRRGSVRQAIHKRGQAEGARDK